MRRILITGAGGFVGKGLVDRLRKEKGVVLKTFDVKNNPKHSLLNKESLVKNVSGCDTVVHLAAINDPKDPNISKINVEGTKNLLEAIKKEASGCKIVFASSFGVYKEPKRKKLIDEEHELSPRNEYGKSKLEAEKLFIKHCKNNSPVTILRISNIYGPNISPFKHSVVATLIDAAKKGRTVNVFGDGTQSRDFVYVDDVVDVFLKAIEVEEGLSICNVCSGEETSIRRLIKIVEETTKKKIDIEYDNNKNSVGYWRGSNKMAKKVLGWIPQTTIVDGVGKIWKGKK